MIERYAPHYIVSTVNAASVATVLIREGIEPDVAEDSVVALVEDIIPFEREQIFKTAALWSDTSHCGLSLGDRACLSLGALDSGSQLNEIESEV
jgi:PIN domain nuclease of toxin-antitoxin system